MKKTIFVLSSIVLTNGAISCSNAKSTAKSEESASQAAPGIKIDTEILQGIKDRLDTSSLTETERTTLYDSLILESSRFSDASLQIINPLESLSGLEAQGSILIASSVLAAIQNEAISSPSKERFIEIVYEGIIETLAKTFSQVDINEISQKVKKTEDSAICFVGEIDPQNHFFTIFKKSILKDRSSLESFLVTLPIYDESQQIDPTTGSVSFENVDMQLATTPGTCQQLDFSKNKPNLKVSINFANTKTVSPYIYGTNSLKSSAAHNFGVVRFGGNRTSTYNWENNASNAGMDYFNQNDAHLGGGDRPGGSIAQFLDFTYAAGSAALITIPLLDYVAADKLGGGDINKSANYLTTRLKKNKAIKGSTFTLNPSLTDDSVYQDEFVNWLKSSYSLKLQSGELLFSLDNEPDLWIETHPRLQASRVTYASLITKTKAYAGMIKNIVPNGVVFGPVNYGWSGMINLQNAPDASGRDFLDFYLTELKSENDRTGKRLVDVLDFHWYPETSGSARIVGSETDAATVQARMAAPRQLWDATYIDPSWISSTIANSAINLLPRMKNKIAAKYPGTKLAITEYYFGGGSHISGAIAQADVLGIFAREGLDYAMLWELASSDYLMGAFDMFRNLDGSKKSVGNTYVATSHSHADKVSFYSYLDRNGSLAIVAINKTATNITAGIELQNGAGSYDYADVYELSSGPKPVNIRRQFTSGATSFPLVMKALGVTTYIFSRGSSCVFQGTAYNSNEAVEFGNSLSTSLDPGVTVTSEPAPTPTPVPTAELKSSLYNGESIGFGAGFAWDQNGTTVVSNTAAPKSPTRHLRFNIKNANGWGGGAYTFKKDASVISFTGYKTLSFYAKANKNVTVGMKLIDQNYDETYGQVNVNLTSRYQLFNIPIDNFQAGVSKDFIIGFMLSTQAATKQTFTIDMDDILILK